MLKNKALNIRRDKMLLASVAIVLALCFSASMAFFCASAGNVRNNVVRLHVIANSNSVVDQQVKLKVRDALLNKNNAMLSGEVNKDNAVEYFTVSRAELLATANEALRINGCDYEADVTLGTEYYTTRQYGELTFPAGEYTSLRVVLGEGKGENWWCVMFPPLCIPVAGDIEADESKAADVLSPGGEEIVSSNGKYIVKFRLLEIYEEIMQELK
ncbi:MAG: stage II sporulation protein R [Clostridia bacterium]|nr:stage II sporulation protein R [Clostridia bacterium]